MGSAGPTNSAIPYGRQLTPHERRHWVEGCLRPDVLVQDYGLSFQSTIKLTTLLGLVVQKNGLSYTNHSARLPYRYTILGLEKDCI